MNFQRLLFAVVPTCVALVACGSDAGQSAGSAGSSSSGAGQPGVSGAPGVAGAVNGSAGANPGVAGTSSGVAGAPGNVAGAPTSGGTSGVAGGATGNGGKGSAAGSGGVSAGTAGAGAGSGSAGAPSGATVEDDGADCPIGTLPEAAALTTNAKLPDPFKKLDGTRMTSKAEWRCRREEIKKLAEKFAYGSKLPKPEMVTGTVSDTSITVKVTDKGKSTTFTAPVKLPTSGSKPYPVIIVYGGVNGAPLDTGVINSEGVALIGYDPYSVGKEGTARTNKQGAYYDIAGNTSSTGLLAAWGWGVSRLIDVITADGKTLKADAVGVTGCSRFGKGSFIAGVFDQRVALTMPIESGTAGVPIWRGIPGEGAQTLSSGYGEQPWFGDAFSSFTSAPTKAPIDTHEVVAMIAPRGLFIMDNPHIANLGPKSASVAALGAAEVYKALGAGDAITYYSDVQDGSHCAKRPEWVTPLKDNIQRFLKKTGNAAGAIKISSKAAGKLADWSDWTTPTLN